MMKGALPIFVDNKSEIGVLMLHGFSSTPDEFRELSFFLAERGFNISVPLIAGHGTKPDDLAKTTSEDWKRSAKEAYLELRKISKEIFLIGNSFGSNLCFYLTNEFNNEPSAIISLGAPIYLRKHKAIVAALYSYGFFKKYYYKPLHLYKIDFIDRIDEITYPKIPVKSLRDFLRFIKRETKPQLKNVKTPVLVIHSDSDPIVDPKSAAYLYTHLGSDFKRIFLFQSRFHTATVDENRMELFRKILDFINEVKDYKNKAQTFYV